MTRVLGTQVIKDISVTEVHVDDPDLTYDVVAKLCIAHVHPNDLHLADVYFQDPYRPLPTHPQKFEVAEHHGYGLLGLTLQRVEAEAKRLGWKHVTLTCAAADLVPLFGKHGYTLETGVRGRLASAMEMKIS